MFTVPRATSSVKHSSALRANDFKFVGTGAKNKSLNLSSESAACRRFFCFKRGDPLIHQRAFPQQETACRDPDMTVVCMTLQRKRRESASSSSSVKKVKKP